MIIFKAWFKEDIKLNELFGPIMPGLSDDIKLTTNGVTDTMDLTVCGELDKVASNIGIGRNWAGIQYRRDCKESIELGEKIAIGILEEQKITHNEKSSFSIRKIDGTTKTI